MRQYRRLILVWVVVVMAMLADAPRAQIAEYDWYASFRTWAQTLPRTQRTAEDLARLYTDKLTTEGVAPNEIERRLSLLRTKRQEMENDFWNRFFTVNRPAFNTEPNAFLASIVEGRTPGKALDVGMGEGRNALFLARLGWDVTGIDPADKAIALAEKRAVSLGLKIRTVPAMDKEFDFGKDQWDLIVYSWMGPGGSYQKVIESLRAGGLVVFEGASAWYPNNQLLRMFDPLRIVHYEDRLAQSDFFGRRDMPVTRLVAEKPQSK